MSSNFSGGNSGYIEPGVLNSRTTPVGFDTSAAGLTEFISFIASKITGNEIYIASQTQNALAPFRVTKSTIAGDQRNVIEDHGLRIINLTLFEFPIGPLLLPLVYTDKIQHGSRSIEFDASLAGSVPEGSVVQNGTYSMNNQYSYLKRKGRGLVCGAEEIQTQEGQQKLYMQIRQVATAIADTIEVDTLSAIWEAAMLQDLEVRKMGRSQARTNLSRWLIRSIKNFDVFHKDDRAIYTVYNEMSEAIHTAGGQPPDAVVIPKSILYYVSTGTARQDYSVGGPEGIRQLQSGLRAFPTLDPRGNNAKVIYPDPKGFAMPIISRMFCSMSQTGTIDLPGPWLCDCYQTCERDVAVVNIPRASKDAIRFLDLIMRANLWNKKGEVMDFDDDELNDDAMADFDGKAFRNSPFHYKKDKEGYYPDIGGKTTPGEGYEDSDDEDDGGDYEHRHYPGRNRFKRIKPTKNKTANIKAVRAEFKGIKHIGQLQPKYFTTQVQQTMITSLMCNLPDHLKKTAAHAFEQLANLANLSNTISYKDPYFVEFAQIMSLNDQFIPKKRTMLGLESLHGFEEIVDKDGGVPIITRVIPRNVVAQTQTKTSAPFALATDIVKDITGNFDNLVEFLAQEINKAAPAAIRSSTICTMKELYEILAHNNGAFDEKTLRHNVTLKGLTSPLTIFFSNYANFAITDDKLQYLVLLCIVFVNVYQTTPNVPIANNVLINTQQKLFQDVNFYRRDVVALITREIAHGANWADIVDYIANNHATVQANPGGALETEVNNLALRTADVNNANLYITGLGVNYHPQCTEYWNIRKAAFTNFTARQPPFSELVVDAVERHFDTLQEYKDRTEQATNIATHAQAQVTNALISQAGGLFSPPTLVAGTSAINAYDPNEKPLPPFIGSYAGLKKFASLNETLVPNWKAAIYTARECIPIFEQVQAYLGSILSGQLFDAFFTGQHLPEYSQAAVQFDNAVVPETFPLFVRRPNNLTAWDKDKNQKPFSDGINGDIDIDKDIPVEQRKRGLVIEYMYELGTDPAFAYSGNAGPNQANAKDVAWFKDNFLDVDQWQKTDNEALIKSFYENLYSLNDADFKKNANKYMKYIEEAFKIAEAVAEHYGKELGNVGVPNNNDKFFRTPLVCSKEFLRSYWEESLSKKAAGTWNTGVNIVPCHPLNHNLPWTIYRTGDVDSIKQFFNGFRTDETNQHKITDPWLNNPNAPQAVRVWLPLINPKLYATPDLKKPEDPPTSASAPDDGSEFYNVIAHMYHPTNHNTKVIAIKNFLMLVNSSLNLRRHLTNAFLNFHDIFTRYLLINIIYARTDYDSTIKMVRGNFFPWFNPSIAVPFRTFLNARIIAMKTGPSTGRMLVKAPFWQSLSSGDTDEIHFNAKFWSGALIEEGKNIAHFPHCFVESCLSGCDSEFIEPHRDAIAKVARVEEGRRGSILVFALPPNMTEINGAVFLTGSFEQSSVASRNDIEDDGSWVDVPTMLFYNGLYRFKEIILGKSEEFPEMRVNDILTPGLVYHWNRQTKQFDIAHEGTGHTSHMDVKYARLLNQN